MASIPLGALLVGGWAAAEAGINVGAVGDKVDSMGGAVAGEPGMNVEAIGDKVDGCAGCWSLLQGQRL